MNQNCFVLVCMRMVVDKGSVAVGMRVNRFFCHGIGHGSSRSRPQKSGHIPQAKNNQHDRDRQLHAQPDSHWNYKIEENDSGSDHEDRKCVAEAPERANHGRPHAVALVADDGGDGDHVIGIGGVAHPEKKSHRENGEKPDHVVHRN